MNTKKILMTFIAAVFALTSGCSVFKKEKQGEDLYPSYPLNNYSEILAETVKKTRTAVVSLVRKRLLESGPHSIELESFVSGVLISEDGYIITNYHNIEKRNISDISVLLLEHPERQYTLQIIKIDPVGDLALLKIEGELPFPYVSIIADSSKIKVGDTVLAIGNAKVVKRYAGNVQKGSVIKMSDYLFTDARVSNGYSGGGLFNLKGELIAIPTKLHNTAKISAAVTANQILDFLSDTPANSLINRIEASLSLMSGQIAHIADTNVPFVVQVIAKPTDEDFNAKMMKVSRIMKINLYRKGSANFQYWYPASGIIVREDGYIVTAYYQVVDHCKNIFVNVFDRDGRKTSYPARVIAYDDDFNVNLALLKIDPYEKLSFAALGHWNVQKPRIGHLVFTIGNTLHFEQSFTGGMISNFTQGLLQTDAAVNNGNLGGPLIDDNGKLIGVIIKREYNLNGVSLAVSADRVLKFIEKYIM